MIRVCTLGGYTMALELVYTDTHSMSGALTTTTATCMGGDGGFRCVTTVMKVRACNLPGHVSDLCTIHHKTAGHTHACSQINSCLKFDSHHDLAHPYKRQFIALWSILYTCVPNCH